MKFELQTVAHLLCEILVWVCTRTHTQSICQIIVFVSVLMCPKLCLDSYRYHPPTSWPVYSITSHEQLHETCSFVCVNAETSSHTAKLLCIKRHFLYDDLIVLHLQFDQTLFSFFTNSLSLHPSSLEKSSLVLQACMIIRRQKERDFKMQVVYSIKTVHQVSVDVEFHTVRISEAPWCGLAAVGVNECVNV